MKIKRTRGFSIVNEPRKGYMIETECDGFFPVTPRGSSGWEFQDRAVPSVAAAKKMVESGEVDSGKAETNQNQPESTETSQNQPDSAGTWDTVCPACLYAYKLIGGMEATLEPIEEHMLDRYGLICEDGSIVFERAKREVNRVQKMIGE